MVFFRWKKPQTCISRIGLFLCEAARVYDVVTILPQCIIFRKLSRKYKYLGTGTSKMNLCRDILWMPPAVKMRYIVYIYVREEAKTTKAL